MILSDFILAYFRSYHFTLKCVDYISSHHRLHYITLHHITSHPILYRGVVQERRTSIANALELRLSCTNSSIYNILPYHSTPYLFISYIIAYHIISYHIISYHIISYHIISYHITYHIIYPIRYYTKTHILITNRSPSIIPWPYFVYIT